MEPKKKVVLSDHKKLGENFIPPMLQIGTFLDIKWLDTILPEILWIGLIIEKFGLEEGNKLTLSLAKTTQEIIGDKKHTSLAYCSSYLLLTENEKQKLKKVLKKKGQLDKIQVSFSDVEKFYPEFPLSFLISTKKSGDLNSIKNIIANFEDRGSRKATLLQAGAYYIQVVLHEISFSSKTYMATARFEEILKYPVTEESKKIASFVRAGLNGFTGIAFKEGKMNGNWVKYFWNRGFELEPCTGGTQNDRQR